MRAGQWLTDVAGAMIATTAEVTSVDRSVSPFVRVGLRAPSFQKINWIPGAKLQVRPIPGKMTMRSYTPTQWDTQAGQTELIGFVHGDGPAAAWFSTVQVGGTLQVYNPRRSIDLTSAGPALFVGDESSVALACALAHVTSDVRRVFEASDPEALAGMVAKLGLAEGTTVVHRTEDRAALLEAAQRTSETFGGSFDLYLSGDASTVHSLRRNARTWSHQPQKTTGKAYWAAGRTGLD